MNPIPLSRPAIAILLLLLAYPQLSQTMYAPVLPDIAAAYGVSAGQAQWTMSLYFAAFALGVLFWGRISDLKGRRPALFGGLCCYVAAAALALVARSFTVLLLARAWLAFGISVGAVVMQTMVRDSYQGPQLTKMFSAVVTVLAFSPAIGPALGMLVASHYGYHGVFACLGLLAALALLCAAFMPETRPRHQPAPVPMLRVARHMLTDRHIWISAALVAGFNLILFGYYVLAPHTFDELGMPHWLSGASGLLLGLAAVGGARLNKLALRHYRPRQLIRRACHAGLAAALLQLLALAAGARAPLPAACAVLATQVVLMLCFACAIPSIFAASLQHYRAVQGSASAMYGLTYYLLIAAGLAALGALYHAQTLAQPVFMLVVSAVLMPVAHCWAQD
ncbi:MFS transporter [Pseudoduganella sp. R-43]|uniref:MFS transporter n=1 Tax=unclassified Pseudoduganella TaxID=2637179 RepID=UPI003CEF3DE8